MIEKIGTDEAKFLSAPCMEMIVYLDKFLKTKTSPLKVAEIGVGYGATSVEIVKRLRETDDFYFYSFHEEVDELYEDLKNQEYCTCNLIPMGNSHAAYDSYCWNLGKQLIDCNKQEGLFDLVYLDGRHSFFCDGLACALLKELIREGGYLIIDDIHWTFGDSPVFNPRDNPEILDSYTLEQIKTRQVQMVIDAFLKGDKDWICERSSRTRAVYRKHQRKWQKR